MQHILVLHHCYFVLYANMPFKLLSYCLYRSYSLPLSSCANVFFYVQGNPLMAVLYLQRGIIILKMLFLFLRLILLLLPRRCWPGSWHVMLSLGEACLLLVGIVVILYIFPFGRGNSILIRILIFYIIFRKVQMEVEKVPFSEFFEDFGQLQVEDSLDHWKVWIKMLHQVVASSMFLNGLTHAWEHWGTRLYTLYPAMKQSLEHWRCMEKVSLVHKISLA